jgi:exodeoxyribonuclease VII large subunit
MRQSKLDLFEERQVLSITDLVHELRATVEGGFKDVWVKGELSNFRAYNSGHWYFSLKDGDSQLSAVCFRLQAQACSFVPEDGLDVGCSADCI